MRDGSQGSSARDFLRALELDPHLAVAHVRMALLGGGNGSLEEARKHVAAAAESRAALDRRDLELLDLARVEFAEATTPDDLAAKAHAIAESLNDDAEVLLWAASCLDEAHREGDEAPLLDRAIALDPRFAAVEHARARALNAVGDLDGGLAAAGRCLAISPTAASCLRRRADVHDARGECASLEQDARELLSMEPAGVQGYGYLTAALAAQAAPVEALRELAVKAAALRTGSGARRSALADEARLFIYEGDFAAAEASLVRMEDDAAGASDETAHLGLIWLTMVREEQGATGRAIAAANDFVRKLPAWVHDWPNRWRPLALAELVRAGRITPEQGRATADAWMREAAPRLGARWRNDIWTLSFAYPAQTEAEARDALAALPAWLPLRNHAGEPDQAGAVGRVYALVGDAEHAVPLLRAEARWCGPVPSGFAAVDVGPSIRAVQDRLLLGQALEQKGDRDGACAEYAAVLTRWGAAKPRSVTADKARARARALGCK
jgi:serine/threonine-protein kinase